MKTINKPILKIRKHLKEKNTQILLNFSWRLWLSIEDIVFYGEIDKLLVIDKHIWF